MIRSHTKFSSTNDLRHGAGQSMSGEEIFHLIPFGNRSRDWTQNELAEFYRVESALIQGGMRILTDRGMSDDGDPWFVFCREDDGEPVVHFARIDGRYVIASPAYDGTMRGRDFRVMVQHLIERHKLIPDGGQNSNVFLHPAALLVFLVGAAFFKTPSQAEASEIRKAAGSAQKTGASPAGSVNPWGLSDFFGQNQASIVNLKLFVIATAVAVTDSAGTHGYNLLVPPRTDPQFLHETFGDNFLSPQSLVDSSALTDVEVAPAAFNSTSSMQAFFRAAQVIPWGAPSSLDGVTAGFDYSFSNVQTTVADGSSGFEHTSLGPNPTFLSSWQKANAIFLNSAYNFDLALLTREISTNKFVASPAANPMPQESVAAASTGSSHADAAIIQTGYALEHFVYHEAAIVVDELPFHLINAVQYASIAVHSGSAAGFLVDNGISITTELGAPLPSSAAALFSNNLVASETASDPHTDLLFDEVFQTESVETNTLTRDLAAKTLDRLFQDTSDVDVILARGDHDDYVFLTSGASNDATMESIIISFDDGSAIRIVGQQQFLHDLISEVS
jgi:hypothetical protein